MNKGINYPVKYAVLELKERGGWLVGYEDITQGFIVSKCYVIESNIIYNSDGSSDIIHKVVFPFKNIEMFKISLINGRQNIGIAEIPRFDAGNKIYPINEVTDLFESYEDAKIVAKEKNEEYEQNIILKFPAPIGIRLSNKNCNEQYDTLKKEFKKGLEVCNLFEQLILDATKDMKISEELSTDKQKSFVKVLKPIKNISK